MEIAPQLTHCARLTGVGCPHRSHNRNGRATSASSFSLSTGSSEINPRESRAEYRELKTEDNRRSGDYIQMSPIGDEIFHLSLSGFPHELELNRDRLRRDQYYR